MNPHRTSDVIERQVAGEPQPAQGGLVGRRFLSHTQIILHDKQNGGQAIAVGALNPLQKKRQMAAEMHPGPTIKALRRRRGLTLEQLCIAIEPHLGKPVNTGNLSRLERGSQGYSNELIQAIARALDVPVAALFSTLPPPPKSLDVVVNGRQSVEIAQVIAGAPGLPATYRVPRLETEARMGASGRVQPEFETIVGEIEVNRHWVRTNLPQITSPANLRIITGYGDSMQGTFSDGDVLFVDVGVKEVRVDAVYVLAMNDELFIKRVQRRPDGAITIISDNKNYEPFIVTERDSVAILGRVVRVWKDTKL